MRGGRLEAALMLVAVAMVAGAVHIASLLAMPDLATEDAYARVARAAPAGVVLLPTAGEADDPLPGRDPAAATAVCLFDLARGPLRVSAGLGRQLYAALSLHSRSGLTFYGLNDRSGNDGRLDLVIMTPAQIEAAVASAGRAPVRDVRVSAPSPRGFVAFDVLPRVGGAAAAAAAARSMRCEVERQP